LGLGSVAPQSWLERRLAKRLLLRVVQISLKQQRACRSVNRKWLEEHWLLELEGGGRCGGWAKVERLRLGEEELGRLLGRQTDQLVAGWAGRMQQSECLVGRKWPASLVVVGERLMLVELLLLLGQLFVGRGAERDQRDSVRLAGGGARQLPVLVGAHLMLLLLLRASEQLRGDRLGQPEEQQLLLVPARRRAHKLAPNGVAVGGPEVGQEGAGGQQQVEEQFGCHEVGLVCLGSF